MTFFAYPWLLTLLLPAAVLIAYYCFFKPQPGVIFGDTAPLAAGNKKPRIMDENAVHYRDDIAQFAAGQGLLGEKVRSRSHE